MSRDPPRARSRWKLFLASWTLDVLYVLASPLLFLSFAVVSRGFTRAKLRRGLLEKLGGVRPRRGNARCYWVHAVSVGEVMTALPLIDELRERFEGWEVIVSVSTETGLEVARSRLPDCSVFYAPFDLSFCVALAMRRKRPDAILLVELELWPNFLAVARRRGVPVFVVNGRMTAGSCRRYARAGPVGRALFAGVELYGVQNERYAERFRQAGVPPGRIAVLGNLKHARKPGASPEDGEAVRLRLGWSGSDGHVVLVAGCTHPGEEAMLCSLLPDLRCVEPGLRCVLVPRHPQRLVRGELDSWECDRPLIRWSRRGEWSASGLGEGVLVADSVGELELFYAAGDMAFVGGSLVPLGGHNVLEPARLAKPVAVGPHTANFDEEVRYLVEARGVRQASSLEDLKRTLEEWLRDPAERRAAGERARAAAARLGGALERHVEWIQRALRLPPEGAT